MNDSIVLTRDGGVATLTLNRPGALNTLDLPMMEALVDHAAALAADPGVRCVVLQGAGKHFMAGGDLRTFAAELNSAPEMRQCRFTHIVGQLHTAIEHFQRMRAPVIASVHGAVAGFGLSLVGACDLAIAADDAYFASAYRQIGLTPDGGGSYTLPRLVGMKKAMEILLLGERFDAHEALRLGLVNRVVPAAERGAATRAMTDAIVGGPEMAIGNAKRLLRQSSSQSLSRQLHAEAVSFGQCAATADFVEGVGAFIAKRPAVFGKR